MALGLVVAGDQEVRTSTRGPAPADAAAFVVAVQRGQHVAPADGNPGPDQLE